MTDEEILTLTAELTDLNTALIFLNDGLRRTEDLKQNKSKHSFPDLDNRILRIQTAIDRFQPMANAIKSELKADEKAKEIAI